MRKLGLAALAIVAFSGLASAQNYPHRAITMIVPFPPGGQADLAARPVALALEKILGKSVVVDNRSGAGGLIGYAAGARAEPDGHTLMMALSSMTFLPEAERLFDRKPSYEYDQLIPIARVLADPGVLCVRSDSPYKSVADLIADAKQRPGQISFSSSGNYGAAHVPFEMFQQAAGIKMLHVPYRGGGPALTAFIGKQVDITAQAPGPITPHVQSGAARLLANWGPKRAAEYPDVPTFIELGYPQIQDYTWVGLFAPAGTPREAVSRLSDAVNQSLQDPNIRARLESLTFEPIGGTPQQFADYLRGEVAKWAKVVKETGAKVD